MDLLFDLNMEPPREGEVGLFDLNTKPPGEGDLGTWFSA
jgi:hypothetical protein